MPSFSTPMKFASSTVSIAAPSNSNTIHLHSTPVYSQHSYALASHAFQNATGLGADVLSDFTMQQQAVISAVASALERNASDPAFQSLPAHAQEAAAMRLVKQCQRGMQVAHAIQSAILNPATMAHQLRAYASGEPTVDVLDQIMNAHRPRTVVSAASVTAQRVATPVAVNDHISQAVA